jgi:hypothetical protein
VVTDCRFPDEAQAIIDGGGEMWLVERPFYHGDSHASETHISEIVNCVTIYNNGTVADLRSEVHNVLDSLHKITSSV